MEHNSLPQMRWRTKIIGAYSLAFAAIATLIGCLPLGLTSSSSTIASSFLSSLKATFLPMGWVAIGPTKSAQLEVDAVVSVFLAFLVCYPIAAYGALRLISPPNLDRKTMAVLVVGAVSVFYGGAAWGLAADRYYITSLVLFFSVPGPSPVISGYDFDIVMMRGILGWALVFITPIFVVFFLELRRLKGLRWHL